MPDDYCCVLCGWCAADFLGFLGEYIMAMNARIMDRPLVVEEKRLNFEPETPESDVVRAQ